MEISRDVFFRSRKTGSKRDGDPWYLLQLRDDESDDFFGVFVEKEVFDCFENVPRNTRLGVVLDLIPGRKSVSLLDYEFK